MELQAAYIVLIVCAVNLVVECEPLSEVCDVEGSGIDDCSIDTYCCRQTECDAAYNSYRPHDNYIDIEYMTDTLRCCSESERKEDPKPSYCKICTECCDETERNKIPLPYHCSKCRSCGHSSTTVRDNDSGKQIAGF